MTTRAAFTPQEWEILLDAPAAAGQSVMAAAPGGLLRETFAIARGWVEAAALFPQSELIQALARGMTPEELQQREARQQAQPAATPPTTQEDLKARLNDIRGRGNSLCRQAVALLTQKATPEETDEYRRFVYYVAEKVAHAAPEGGFFGIGGVRVSAEEQTALQEIAMALRYTPPAVGG